MKMLSRNCPVAIVVGAGGFLGSHLVEELLSKKIQVVGVDNFKSGKQENLLEASKDKNFHLLSQPAMQPLPGELPRLDYAFFVISEDLPVHEFLVSLETFISECRDLKPKIVFVSSLNLYDLHENGRPAIREAEKRLAEYATEHQINARVVRLAAVYGPRMHFRGKDPMLQLIKAAIVEELPKEVNALDFTTRSLYIDDAVNLLIKTVMHGATAQKIYDGALLYPIKVAEVKQVLLDPLWHESRGFVPTDLPPWPSPNLEKTMRELSWEPKVPLVEGLKETLKFFKENPEIIEQTKKADQPVPVKEETPKEEPEKNEEDGEEVKVSRVHLPKWPFKEGRRVKNYFLVGVGLLVIVYALVFPLVTLALLGVNLNSYLTQGSENLSLGNVSAASVEAALAKRGVENLQQTLKALDFVSQTGIGQVQMQSVTEAVNVCSEAVEALTHGTVATTAVADAFRHISGEEEGSGLANLAQAEEELSVTNRLLGLVLARLSDNKDQNILTGLFQGQVKGWQAETTSYQQTAEYGQSLIYLLSQMIPDQGKKEYLVLLQDNSTLRPGGGAELAYAQVSFANGKLVNVQADSVLSLDQSQKEKIAPPVELGHDLGESTWLMKDAASEADGPSNGKTLQWFYSQDKGTTVDGVFLLDETAVKRLLQIFGPVSLGNGATVTADNFTDSISSPSTAGQISAAVLKELLQRLFFLSKQNWLDLTNTLGLSLDEKHIIVYLSDTGGLSFLESQDWLGLLPRQQPEGTGERDEFLATSETNTGASGSNKNVKRSYVLEDSMMSDGEVNHKLTITYTSGTVNYDYRLKIYLAGGSKLNQASWGGADITSSVAAFSDYGRAGYSATLSLSAGESKSLVLKYTDAVPPQFDNGKLNYRTDFVKQPGTGADTLEYKISYPLEFKVADGNGKANPLVFTTDFSRDRQFSITLQKP